MALSLKDVQIDINSLGSQLLFASQSEYFDYDKVTGKRSENPAGVKVEVLLAGKAMERLAVKVPGMMKFLDVAPLTPIKFTDLTVSAYLMNGKLGFTATAKAATANTKA